MDSTPMARTISCGRDRPSRMPRRRRGRRWPRGHGRCRIRARGRWCGLGGLLGTGGMSFGGAADRAAELRPRSRGGPGDFRADHDRRGRTSRRRSRTRSTRTGTRAARSSPGPGARAGAGRTARSGTTGGSRTTSGRSLTATGRDRATRTTGRGGFTAAAVENLLRPAGLRCRGHRDGPVQRRFRFLLAAHPFSGGVVW